MLPAFFGGKCAMTVQGNFPAQGMILQSPKGFNWAMFPLLKGKTQDQVANPQTISISQQSEHKEEAMQFIAYFVERREHGEARGGRLAHPGEPGRGKLDPQVDEADRQLAHRHVLGRPLPEGELGVARRVPALEGGGGAAAVRPVPEGTRSPSRSWARTCRTAGTESAG